MALGMALLAGCGAGGDGGDTAEPTDPPGTPSPEPEDTPSPAGTPAAAITIDVGPDAEFRFEPETFTIAAGETVRWAFLTGGHNVKPGSIPDGADWDGTPGGDFETVRQDTAYHATFPVAGEYEYVCAPHEASGMVGSFTVEG